MRGVLVRGGFVVGTLKDVGKTEERRFGRRGCGLGDCDICSPYACSTAILVTQPSFRKASSCGS